MNNYFAKGHSYDPWLVFKVPSVNLNHFLWFTAPHSEVEMSFTAALLRERERKRSLLLSQWSTRGACFNFVCLEACRDHSAIIGSVWHNVKLVQVSIKVDSVRRHTSKWIIQILQIQHSFVKSFGSCKDPIVMLVKYNLIEIITFIINVIIIINVTTFDHYC